MSAGFLVALETATAEGSVALAAADGTLLAAADLPAGGRHASAVLPALAALLQQRGLQLRDAAAVCFSQGPGSFTGLRVAATIARMLQSVSGCAVVGVPTPEVIAANAVAPPVTGAVAGAVAVAVAGGAALRLVVLLDARAGHAFVTRFEPPSGGTPASSTCCASDESSCGASSDCGAGDPSSGTAAGECTRGTPGEAARAVNDAGPATRMEPLERVLTGCGPGWLALGPAAARHAAALRAAGAALAPHWDHPRAERLALLGAARLAAGRVLRPEEILPLYVRPPEAEELYESRRAAARARRGE